MKVGIIGLGLIGGSLGLNLKENKLVSSVVGYDVCEKNAKRALELGLVHEIVDFDTIKKSDIIFLSVPVNAIIDILKKLEDVDEHTTIVELGSTKLTTYDSVSDKLKNNLILAHPMAGTEFSGPDAALKKLFENAVCVLCDSEKMSSFHTHRAIELLTHLGMKITFMDSKSHDERTAVISHLPHVISFSLANLVLNKEDKSTILHLAGGSFSDMSRIAKSSPIMWESVFRQNKDNVLNSLREFKKELELFENMLQNDEYETIIKWMKNANKLKDIL